jgi:hypothetical protein
MLDLHSAYTTVMVIILVLFLHIIGATKYLGVGKEYFT